MQSRQQLIRDAERSTRERDAAPTRTTIGKRTREEDEEQQEDEGEDEEVVHEQDEAEEEVEEEDEDEEEEDPEDLDRAVEEFREDGGRIDVGGRQYRRDGDTGTFDRGDGRRWRVKNSRIQLSYSLRQLVGSLVYRHVVGDGPHAELHFGQNSTGVLVIEQVPGFEPWLSSARETPQDAIGVGKIAVAAWFAGESDMHGANFGTRPGTDNGPRRAVVVDASGALDGGRLATSMEQEDLDRLPAEPAQWPDDDSTSWQVDASLSDRVRDRLAAEKREALEAIRSLDLDALGREIREHAFVRGEAMQTGQFAEVIAPEWGEWKRELLRRKSEAASLVA